jgi:hypothetical protein
MMTNLEKEAKPAVELLLRKDEDQLYKELGMRTKALEQDISVAGSFDPEVTYNIAMGPMDEVLKLGQRLFNRWTVEANKLLCGAEAEDIEDREKLRNALGINDVAVAALLAAVLVSQLGIAAALAAVLAALIVKRFFHPTYEEFCKAWTKNLPEV